MISTSVCSVVSPGARCRQRRMSPCHIGLCCCFDLIRLTRHSEVEVRFTVVVGFAKTDDGHNPRQGATFARSDRDKKSPQKKPKTPGIETCVDRSCVLIVALWAVLWPNWDCRPSAPKSSPASASRRFSNSMTATARRDSPPVAGHSVSLSVLA